MTVNNIPVYLLKRLNTLAIDCVAELECYGYLQAFAGLCDKYPSITYKALYDMYCLVSGVPLNSLDADTEKQLRLSYKQILPCYAPLSGDTITKYLDLALEQAKLAASCDEIPIAALVVKNDRIIGSGYNLNKVTNKVSNHAEIIALEKAAQYLGSSYLFDCDLYVTIEPCLMCSGAIIHSRLKRVIFGALEAKTGAVVSQYQVFKNRAINHHTELIGPINTAKYSKPLRDFLQSKR